MPEYQTQSHTNLTRSQARPTVSFEGTAMPEEGSVISRRIRGLRLENQCRLLDLANHVGLAESTVSRYEDPNRDWDLIRRLKKIAEFYGVTLDFLCEMDKSRLSKSEQALLRKIEATLTLDEQT